jgi:hypothetical protein
MKPPRKLFVNPFGIAAIWDRSLKSKRDFS